jgi:hypothetical protein
VLTFETTLKRWEGKAHWYCTVLWTVTLYCTVNSNTVLYCEQWRGLSRQCTVPTIHVRFLSNLNFLNRLSKNTQTSSLIKNRPKEN